MSQMNYRRFVLCGALVAMLAMAAVPLSAQAPRPAGSAADSAPARRMRPAKRIFSMSCLGDFIGARTTAEAAARRFEEIGSHVRSAEPHSLAALCDMEAGQGDRAEIGARQALDISPEGDYTLAVRVNLAEILVSRGKLAEGAALAERAVREGREAGLGSLLMYALLVSGAAKARGGRYSDAEADFVEALEPATAERDAWMYAQGLRWFGEAKAASGMYEEGISLLVDARERFSQMGGVHELRKVAEAIDRAERDRQRADGP